MACAGDPLDALHGNDERALVHRDAGRGQPAFLLGPRANRPDDVWFTGGQFVPGPDLTAYGMFAHFDGCAWTVTQRPDLPQLSGVWGAAPNDVWMVGAGSDAYHWNGSAVTAVPVPGATDAQVRQRYLGQRRVGRRQRHLPLERQRMGAVLRERGRRRLGGRAQRRLGGERRDGCSALQRDDVDRDAADRLRPVLDSGRRHAGVCRRRGRSDLRLPGGTWRRCRGAAAAARGSPISVGWARTSSRSATSWSSGCRARRSRPSTTYRWTARRLRKCLGIADAGVARQQPSGGVVTRRAR